MSSPRDHKETADQSGLLQELQEKIHQLERELAKNRIAFTRQLKELNRKLRNDLAEAKAAFEKEYSSRLAAKAAMEEKFVNEIRSLKEINTNQRNYQNLLEMIGMILEGSFLLDNEKNIQAFQDAWSAAIEYINTNTEKAKALVSTLTVNDCAHLMPLPQANDGYAELYHLIHSRKNMIQLAHRFEIPGVAMQQGEEIKLEGFSHIAMIKSMMKSFHEFVETDSEAVITELCASAQFADFTPDQLREMLQTVDKDVAATIVNAEETKIDNVLMQDGVLHLPTRIDKHAICVSISGNLLLISDKSRAEEAGIEIYEIACDNPDVVKKQVATQIARGSQYLQEKMPPSTEAFTEQLGRDFNLQRKGMIPLSEQLAGNCTWSSCAKSLLINAFYLRCYEAAVKSGKDDAAAHVIAEKYARKIRKIWSLYDKASFLKHYLAHQRDNEKYYDPSVLARAKVKSEHREKNAAINQLLSGSVTKEQCQAARERYHQATAEYLREYYPALTTMFNENMDTITNKLAELYLLIGKHQIDDFFDLLLECPSSTDAVRMLNEEIAKVKTNKSGLVDHSFLNRNPDNNNNEKDASNKLSGFEPR